MSSSSDRVKFERNKANFMPPFWCCQDAQPWDTNSTWKRDTETFNKFFRIENLSYHLHRYNLHRVRPREDAKEGFQISMFVQKPMNVKNGKEKETVLNWDLEWLDFYVPSESVHIEPTGRDLFRDDEVHSCHNWGLVMADYATVIEDRYGKTGLSMDIYCSHHGHFFHINKLGLIEPGKEYEPITFESSTEEPIRSELGPIDEDSEDDFFYMAPVKKKMQNDPKRKSIAGETIVEDDWLYVNEPRNGLDLHPSPDANGNIVV